MMMSSDMGTKPMLSYAGVMNNNSNGYDFSECCQHGEIITGLKVHWKQNTITGIELAYNGKPTGKAVNGSESNGSQEDVYSLDQGDAVVELFGRYSKVINCFGVRTLRGKTRVWGSPTDGEAFNFSADNSYIKSMKVRASNFVEYLEPVYGNIFFLGAKPWQVSNQAKISEHFCGPTKGDEEFTDFEWVQDKFNYNVAKVTVWFDPSFITGIQFHYGVDGTVKSPGQHLADNGQANKKAVLELAEGEFISSVFVKYAGFLTFIQVSTTKGNSLTVGNAPNGDGYLFNVPNGHQIVATSGEFGTAIRRLRLHFDEIY
jgi:Jacalin-like lectin domain